MKVEKNSTEKSTIDWNLVEIFQSKLNEDVPESLVKEFQSRGYLPISYVQITLDKILPIHKVEILNQTTTLHSAQCTVRVHYLHPILNEWLFKDGTGAVAYQLKKDSPKFGIEYLTNDSVKVATPNAYAHAFTNACRMLGKVFGRDLARKTEFVADTENVDSLVERMQTPEQRIQKAETISTLKRINTSLGDKKTPEQSIAMQNKAKEIKENLLKQLKN